MRDTGCMSEISRPYQLRKKWSHSQTTSFLQLQGFRSPFLMRPTSRSTHILPSLDLPKVFFSESRVVKAARAFRTCKFWPCYRHSRFGGDFRLAQSTLMAFSKVLSLGSCLDVGSRTNQAGFVLSKFGWQIDG